MLDRIKLLCTDRGIKSLNELERRAGIAPKTIYRWQNVMPGADKLHAVAKVLGVTVDELLKE